MPVYKAATVGRDESGLRRHASTMPANPPSDNNKADVGSGTEAKAINVGFTPLPKFANTPRSAPLSGRLQTVAGGL